MKRLVSSCHAKSSHLPTCRPMLLPLAALLFATSGHCASAVVDVTITPREVVDPATGLRNVQRRRRGETSAV